MREVWAEYLDQLLYTENPREELEEADVVEGAIWEVLEEEVTKAVKV